MFDRCPKCRSFWSRFEPIKWKFTRLLAEATDDEQMRAYYGMWTLPFHQYEHKRLCLNCFFELQMAELDSFVAFVLGWNGQKSKKFCSFLQKYPEKTIVVERLKP